MKTSDIKDKLKIFAQTRPLYGIENEVELNRLSLHVSEFAAVHAKWQNMADLPVSHHYANPQLNSFEPRKAAVWHFQQGNKMEAWWLIMLSYWFGESPKSGWALLKAVYTGKGSDCTWNWQAVANEPEAFGRWLVERQADLKRAGTLGPHHKQTAFDMHTALKAQSVFTVFISWWSANYSDMMAKYAHQPGATAQSVFRDIYAELKLNLPIDTGILYHFLKWGGMLKLADISPDTPFLSTGGIYKKAARDIFQSKKDKKQLNGQQLAVYLTELAACFELPFSHAIIEEAILAYYENE